MKDLQDIRREIDAVDEQICALLDRRAALSDEVAAYKSAHNLPVVNEAREQQVIENAVARCTLADADTVQTVFRTLISASCDRQTRRLQK